MVTIFIIAIYILQVGYCVLLVFSRNPETKRALIKGCGFPLMLSNWVIAFWAISWVRTFPSGSCRYTTHMTSTDSASFPHLDNPARDSSSIAAIL